MSDDHFARMDYRRLIAWGDRLEREWPFFASILEAAPGKQLLDIGCGTGEHAAHFARMGFSCLGVDPSAAQIEKSREYQDGSEMGSRLQFSHGSMQDLRQIVKSAATDQIDAAFCVGNVLPYLDDEALAIGLRALASVLRLGAPFALQILNYERIVEHGHRHLPLNFRAGDDGDELVFVRLMRDEGNGWVRFYPTTLRLPADSTLAPELSSARSIRVRAWTRAELSEQLAAAGFTIERVLGSVDGSAYDPATSQDCIMVARRPD